MDVTMDANRLAMELGQSYISEIIVVIKWLHTLIFHYLNMCYSQTQVYFQDILSIKTKAVMDMINEQSQRDVTETITLASSLRLKEWNGKNDQRSTTYL